MSRVALLSGYSEQAARIVSIFSASPSVGSRELMEKWRWPNGVRCEVCPSERVFKLIGKTSSYRPSRRSMWKCSECRSQFTVTVASVMHGSHVSLEKWMASIELVALGPSVSSHELKSLIGCTQRTALNLARRMRRGFKDGWFCDEYFFEQKKNEHGKSLLDHLRTVVPAGIDSNLRSDIIQEIAAAILLGELSNRPSGSDIKGFISRAYKQFADRFGTVSLNQPIGRDDGLTLGEAMGIF